jgi:hypothetical protein
VEGRRVTRLSIIIPMLGDPELMETGLVSVLENRPVGCEVLLALNGEYGNPYELDDEVRFVAAPDGAPWAESCNLAVEQAAAEIVHLLMPGVEATAGWTDAPLRHFRDADMAAVTPLVLDRRRRGRILAAGVGYRAGRRLICGRYQAEHQVAKLPKTPVVGPSRLAGFYRKSYLTALGGFETALGDELADVDLALRMQRAGLRTAVEPASLVCAGPLKKLPGGFRGGLCTERLLLRNAESLGKLALTRPLAWFAGLTWRMFYPPRALGHLTGQLGAWCELPRHLRYRGSRDQLQTSVADQKAPPRGDSRVDAAHSHASPRARAPLRVSA